MIDWALSTKGKTFLCSSYDRVSLTCFSSLLVQLHIHESMSAIKTLDSYTRFVFAPFAMQLEPFFHRVKLLDSDDIRFMSSRTGKHCLFCLAFFFFLLFFPFFFAAGAFCLDVAMVTDKL